MAVLIFSLHSWSSYKCSINVSKLEPVQRSGAGHAVHPQTHLDIVLLLNKQGSRDYTSLCSD